MGLQQHCQSEMSHVPQKFPQRASLQSSNQVPSSSSRRPQGTDPQSWTHSAHTPGHSPITADWGQSQPCPSSSGQFQPFEGIRNHPVFACMHTCPRDSLHSTMQTISGGRGQDHWKGLAQWNLWASLTIAFRMYWCLNPPFKHPGLVCLRWDRPSLFF